MTTDHPFPLSQAIFDLNREIGSAALLKLIGSIASEADCETDDEFELWSVSFESDLARDTLRIDIRFIDNGEICSIEIDMNHAQQILEATHSMLSDIYKSDRKRDDLRKYYVSNLSNQLSI